MLWMIFSVLMAIVLFFVLKPMWRPADDGATLRGADADIAVYRDQLAEIDADLERGLLGAGEAVAARTEVSRRLLKHGATPDDTGPDDAGERGAPAPGVTRADVAGYSSAVFIGTFIAIPAMALSLYVYNGSPNMPGQPHAMRVNTTNKVASIDVLVAKAEAQLRQSPEQGEGWEVLAPIYLRQRRFGKAVEAYGRALDLLGESPRRLSGYAASLISQNNGIVGEGARKAFVRLNALQPGRSDVRFWLAVAMEQDGKLTQAASEYRAMLESAPENAPWRGMVVSKLNEVESRIAGGPSGGPSRRGSSAGSQPTDLAQSNAGDNPGPTASDITAARNMTAGDRQAMINQMVARLADRLKTKGDDLKGWQRLVRAYVVLGKTDEAKQALKDARANFAGNSAALGVLDNMGKQL